MKEQRLFARRLLTVFLPTLLLLVGIGCSEDPPVSTGDEHTHILLGNFAADGEPFDVLLDDVVLRDGLSYGTVTGYISAETGTHTLRLRTGSVSGPTVFPVEKEVMLGSENNYTALATSQNGTPELMLLEDDIPEEKTGKAFVRLVHLSPNEQAIDIVDGNGNTLLENYEYLNQDAPFTEVDAGTYTFNVRLTNTNKIETRLENANLEEGGAYTLVLKGLKGETGETELGLALIHLEGHD